MFHIEETHTKKHGNQYCQCCREAGERQPAQWGFKRRGVINAFCDSHKTEGSRLETEHKRQDAMDDGYQSEGERQAQRGFGLK